MMKVGDTRKVAERMENWMSHGIVGFCPYFSTHLGLQNDPGYCTMLHPRMAGPPIPEDEDVTTTPQNAPWPEPQVPVRFWEPWILMNSHEPWSIP